ncbi:MAG: helix-turn-helix transcriptional regulator [Spirochaetes bacterium]|nr:helix-turn-helix transcriptional regulator [Spirochaetota bacterium]
MKVLTKEEFLEQEFPFMIKKYSHTDFPPHRHEFLEFFYVNGGTGQHHLNGKVSVLNKGDLYVMNPDHEHAFSQIGSNAVEIITCIFTQSFLESHFALAKKVDRFVEFIHMRPFQREGYAKLHLDGMADVKVRGLLHEMLEEYEKRPAGFEIALKAKLTDLLITLVRFYDAHKDAAAALSQRMSKKSRVVFDSIAYVNRHFRERITLEEIIKRHGTMTKEYFCVLFKRITGKTFVEYLTETRIDYAKKLLSFSTLTVTDICFESGFHDLSNFERTFHRAAGCPPKKFRQANAVRTETADGQKRSQDLQFPAKHDNIRSRI